MFGGTSNNEGVWGFAALAQGVRGLGLGSDDFKLTDFGGWRSKTDDEPDSPEGKRAAADVPVVVEAKVGTLVMRVFVVKISRVKLFGRRFCQGVWC